MRQIHRKARVGDIDIHYELADYTAPWRSTPADAVLLYHGYSRNMDFWRKWMPLLAGDFRVVRLDSRGCGETSVPAPGSAWSFDQLMDDALGLMDHLGIERFHWVGESSGGIVGLNTALKQPQRLLSLTLCDTPFKRPSDIAATYSLGQNNRAEAFAKFGVGGWCRQTLSHRIDTTRASPELCEWYIAEMDRTPVHVAVEMERIIGQGDFLPHLSKIATPTLILGGANSTISKPEMMREMQSKMPSAQRVALEGYGHGVNLLAPQRCVEAFNAFVHGLPAQR
jgi:pimeloyl-ACP methyl ester carboxylesterase